MAQQIMEGLMEREQFCCPICLDLLQDPVAIPCGHSYCMGCIKGYWGKDDKSKVFSCPQCRQSFSPRPILNRNTILAEMVEKLRKTEPKKSGLQTATTSAHVFAVPGDVECDFCTEKKRKAVKSCLVCLASYCNAHLQPHYQSNALKKHRLIEASMHLQEKICPHHDKILEIYCQTDQQCICLLCVMDEHKGHDTVSAAAESAKKQKQLGMLRRKFKVKIHAKEKELQELRQALDSLRSAAHAALDNSEKIFAELMQSIERRLCEVRELVETQEETATGLLIPLEQEIAELKRQDNELELLVNTEDHIHFLQTYQSFSAPVVLDDLPSVTISPLFDFGKMNSAVSGLKKRVEDVLKVEWPKISRAASSVKIVQSPVPKIRPEFLYHSCHLVLDPRTAHRDLSLSQENRVVTVRNREHSCPDHPERFDYWCQVLASEGLSGCYYWEVEWSGMGVNMAVAYQDIVRKGEGNNSHFGHNEKSWSLFCSKKGYAFWHNNVVTKIPGSGSPKIGVYLDHRAGSLSFYSVSDTMTLIHRVQATFTKPLFPGFEFACYRASIRLCQME
ncbi:tripartite motif-containing protein 16 [Chanos chanos]|uniref:Tripartite motif-containing protein 16 n=1 Tax=Chanos chanos TaxID=29144 RepID=A0A6J2VI55_CHACN|nr:tripartite motif-containing protein 16-like [Chanos chanos]